MILSRKGARIMSQLQIYDAGKDELRPVTQNDIDRLLEQCSNAFRMRKLITHIILNHNAIELIKEFLSKAHDTKYLQQQMKEFDL